MNARLKRILEEIKKTEKRIAEWQEHLKDLNVRRKQLEDAEIVKSVRSMKLDSRQLLEVLDNIQNGAVSFGDIDMKVSDNDALITKETGGGNQVQDAAENKEDDNSEDEN